MASPGISLPLQSEFLVHQRLFIPHAPEKDHDGRNSDQDSQPRAKYHRNAYDKEDDPHVPRMPDDFVWPIGDESVSFPDADFDAELIAQVGLRKVHDEEAKGIQQEAWKANRRGFSKHAKFMAIAIWQHQHHRRCDRLEQHNG